MGLVKKKPKYRRGDIFWTDLEPARGNEARKTRPCLILQNNIGNEFSSVTVVVPFLEPKDYPFVVNIMPSVQNGLDRERGLNFSQLRVAHFSRFSQKLGQIDDNYWGAIEEAIAVELAIFGR
jgi:mRNA interferase MazF